MKGINKITTFFLMGIALFSSCIEDQDFDQYDDLALEPVLEASILYVEAPERVINLATATNFYTEDFNFDAFSADVFADRVIDGSITYIVTNTTSKELEVSIQFLDEGANVLDTENFTIAPAPTAVLQREIAYGGTGRSIDIIRNTSSIRVSALNLGDTTSTSNLPDPKVTLQSSGKFRVEIK
ncbi:hypothetical protein FK220_002800 [Flavobacteriaceae bacterium TP-CH-4]|uniref:Uncharacterized protein n=1 Tax=Pelagihabitans pacificus TaxID=2696054 RepID=A0A967AS80_9FLAO|nr:hypothetical protein [Pelagihabitans pacificus]NHF58255.1 hypothetical protein [Pelagihabitans pacificus]